MCSYADRARVDVGLFPSVVRLYSNFGKTLYSTHCTSDIIFHYKKGHGLLHGNYTLYKGFAYPYLSYSNLPSCFTNAVGYMSLPIEEFSLLVFT